MGWPPGGRLFVCDDNLTTVLVAQRPSLLFDRTGAVHLEMGNVALGG